jgi:anti-anti-sigma factor
MNDYSFEVVKDDGGPALRLVGELDLATVGAFRDAVEELPSDGALTLDLSELTYIDSSGLHAIVECANSVNGEGGVHIAHANPSVVRVLRLVSLDKHPNLTIAMDGDGR